MKVWVRNLTKDRDFCIELPMDERELDKIIDPNNEYIITDSEVVNMSEYDNIYELNEFLFDCKENGISIDTLEVLSRTYLYDEVIEMVDNLTFTIVDFDSETYGWNCGTGGNFSNAFDKGMCLYHAIGYKPFSFEVTEENHDWIDWSSVWTNAETEDWREVVVNGNHYLVHR